MPKRKSVAALTLNEEQARAMLFKARPKVACSVAIKQVTQVVDALARVGGRGGTIARILEQQYKVNIDDHTIRRHILGNCACKSAK